MFVKIFIGQHTTLYKIILIIISLTFIFCIVYLVLIFNVPYGERGKEILIEIEKGKGLREIAGKFEENKLIRNSYEFILAYKLFFLRKTIKAGEYKFILPQSLRNVLEKVIRGEVFLRTITVREGMNVYEVSENLRSNMILKNKEEFIKETENPSYINDLVENALNLEGFLYPDTYLFPKNESPEKVVSTMTERFKSIFNEDLRSRAQEIKMSIKDIIILASLIEKETSLKYEKPLISSVFHKRLKIGIPLQCDPTVIYAYRKKGILKEILSRDDLKINSPYNTYIHRGLPPTPICSPGKDSIEAALYPANTNFLYFVSKGDGSHYFSKNISEHNKAVKKFRSSSNY
ncbi:MAG: endolytic transglycosylase MltG [Acidobacteriota bacterium]